MTMYLRGAAWLVVLAALGAAQLIDGSPADPVRTSIINPPVKPTLIYSAAGWSARTARLRPSSNGAQDLPAELRAFTAMPELVRGVAESFRVLSRAEARDLHEPVVVYTQFFAAPGFFSPGEQPGFVCIYPAWDTQAAYASNQGLHLRLNQVNHFESGDGYVFQRDTFQTQASVQEFWASYRRGLSAVLPESEVDSSETLTTRFWPTGFLHPLGDADPWFDDMLLGSCQNSWWPDEPLPADLFTIPGGLVAFGFASHHAQISGRLTDLPYIRLARALRAGSPRRRAIARRAALSDDDPRLVELALLELASRPDCQDELPYLDPSLLLLATQRFSGPPNSYREGSIERLLARLRPAAAARQIESLARTTTEPDDLSTVCGLALIHPAAEVRRAGLNAVLRRLPYGALTKLTFVPEVWCASGAGPNPPTPLQAKPAVANWPMAEREAFCGALVDRLRAEVVDGDPHQAMYVAQEAMQLCGLGFLPATSAAQSRLLELNAQLLLDTWTQDLFMEGSERAVLAAAAELSRNSHPEVRRIGAALLAQFSQTGDELLPLWGDHYTADITDRDYHERRGRRGSGFFFK